MQTLGGGKQKILASNRGFTLIELMIVVGIIGILVAIASPQYLKYQRRAKQSEAKLALAAIYSLQKAFFTEHASYIGALDAIGYAPEGSKRYYDHQATADCAAAAGGATGYAGSYSVPCFLSVGGLPRTNTYNASSCVWVNGAAYVANMQTFNAYAAGNFGSPYDDVWQIDNQKYLRNCALGL